MRIFVTISRRNKEARIWNNALVQSDSTSVGAPGLILRLLKILSVRLRGWSTPQRDYAARFSGNKYMSITLRTEYATKKGPSTTQNETPFGQNTKNRSIGRWSRPVLHTQHHIQPDHVTGGALHIEPDHLQTYRCTIYKYIVRNNWYSKA